MTACWHRVLAAAVLVAVALPAAAEFHAWTDAEGRRRISNVAPSGVRIDGGLREGYHPYSVSAQHARLRAKLERQGAAIEAAAAEEAPVADGVLPFTLDLFDGVLGP